MRRIWAKPLAVHILAAAGLLLIGLMTLRPLGPVVSDEGAYVLQARHLNSTGEWLIESPLPQLDPSGNTALIPNGDRGEKGRAFYAKHPLYPSIIAVLDRIDGRTAFFLLSIAGTLGSALSAALIAREFGRPGPGTLPANRRNTDESAGEVGDQGNGNANAERLAFWLTAGATPLFFDAYLIVGHSLVAAGAGCAAWLTLRHLSRKRWEHLLAASVVCALCSALRSEGLFVGFALAMAVLVAARQTVTFRRRTVIAGSLLAATTIGFVLDRYAAWRIVGSIQSGILEQDVGFLYGRWNAFTATWLTPSFVPDVQSVFLFVGLGGLIAAVVARRKSKTGLVRALWVLIAVAYLGGLIVSERQLIPGILFTAPVVVYGCIAAARELRHGPQQVTALAAAGIALAVISTQYWFGGGAEWGGRFFAPLLPLAAALGAKGLLSTDGIQRGERVVPSCMAITSAVLCLWVLSVIGHGHRSFASLTATVKDTIADYQPSGVDSSSTGLVIIWKNGLSAQSMWEGVDVRNWLGVARPTQSEKESAMLFETTLANVIRARPAVFAIVTSEPDADSMALPPTMRVVDRRTPRYYSQTVLVVRPVGV